LILKIRSPLPTRRKLRTNALPHIVVQPKPPPNTPPADGIDDWFVPTSDGYPDDWFVPASDGYPDDWFLPTPSATPNTGQLARSVPAAADPGRSNPAPARPDPFAAYWSLIPASRVGAMAWYPPVFLGDPPTFPPDSSTTSAWRARPPARIPNLPTSGGILGGLAKLGSPGPVPGIPLGGLFDSLAQLGSSDSVPGSSFPPGGFLSSLAQLGSSTADANSSFLSPSQPQSAAAQTVPPVERRPITDYSTGEILGDAAKSFGVGVGRFGIQGAGLFGDARELIANGAQRAADYFAPDSAPNAGSKVSDFLASYSPLAGPTSSQLQSAVESYTGPFYQPKTIVGDYAQTAGEFVPGALLLPEGSLAANALRYGLLPALSSETVGQLTEGTAAEPWARTVGGILGAAPGAWRALPWARSAPSIAKPLPPPVFDRVAQLRLNAEAGRAAEEAVGIPANAPKPSTKIPGSGTVRFPDRVTEETLEEVKNVKYLALTQQIRDYLAYAQANQLTFILHVHPETEYSGPLQQLIDAGQISERRIVGLSK
jgi:hypothetical protein